MESILEEFFPCSDEMESTEVTPPPTTNKSKPVVKVTKARRLGKKSRNPYLMFLRDFRAQHFALSAVEMIRQGAKEWNQLSVENKFKYYKSSHQVPRRPRKSRKSRARSRTRSQSESESGEANHSKSQLRRATSYIS